MLKFECLECGNTTALVYKDQEGDMVTECLACEDIQTVTSSEGMYVNKD